MRPADLRELVRKQPFEPFRLHLSNGVHYDVPHPEMVIVTRTQVVVAVGSRKEDLPEQLVYCDPLHITHIEPINGAKPKGRKKKSE